MLVGCIYLFYDIEKQSFCLNREFFKGIEKMEGSSLKLISRYRTHIMGFAALWILIFHAWTVVSEQYSFVWRFEYFVKKTGFAGVDIFLLLSGMGLVYSIGKNNLKEFYLRRFLNIYPAFFITGIVLIFTRGWDLITFLENVLCIRFYTTSIYQLLWFVPAILTLYIVFPWYYKMLRKMGNAGEVTLCVIMIWMFLSICLEGTLREDLYGFTNRIPVFLVGVLIGEKLREGDIEITLLKWTVIIVGFLLGIYLSYYTNIKEQRFLVPVSNCCAPNLLMAIFGSILLARFFWVLEHYAHRIGKVILQLFLQAGTVSFEMYCAQEEVGLLREKLEIQSVLLENFVVFAIILIITGLLYALCRLLKAGIEKAVGKKW